MEGSSDSDPPDELTLINTRITNLNESMNQFVEQAHQTQDEHGEARNERAEKQALWVALTQLQRDLRRFRESDHKQEAELAATEQKVKTLSMAQDRLFAHLPDVWYERVIAARARIITIELNELMEHMADMPYPVLTKQIKEIGRHVTTMETILVQMERLRKDYAAWQHVLAQTRVVFVECRNKLKRSWNTAMVQYRHLHPAGEEPIGPIRLHPDIIGTGSAEQKQLQPPEPGAEEKGAEGKEEKHGDRDRVPPGNRLPASSEESDEDEPFPLDNPPRRSVPAPPVMEDEEAHWQVVQEDADQPMVPSLSKQAEAWTVQEAHLQLGRILPKDRRQLTVGLKQLLVYELPLFGTSFDEAFRANVFFAAANQTVKPVEQRRFYTWINEASVYFCQWYLEYFWTRLARDYTDPKWVTRSFLDYSAQVLYDQWHALNDTLHASVDSAVYASDTWTHFLLLSVLSKSMLPDTSWLAWRQLAKLDYDAERNHISLFNPFRYSSTPSYTSILRESECLWIARTQTSSFRFQVS